jgi:hypothetical protein
MKKGLLNLACMFLLLVVVTGCGSKKEESASNNESNVPNIEESIGGNHHLNEYDQATREALIRAAREEGGDMEFRPDGSVIITDSEGNMSIQNPDGTWTYKTTDGEQSQYGGNWPDNEFTKLVPKPDLAVLATNTTEDEFGVVFSEATLAQVKAYTEEVKKEGFTVEPETNEQIISGVQIYSYTAKNEDGYELEISYSAGAATFKIYKDY